MYSSNRLDLWLVLAITLFLHLLQFLVFDNKTRFFRYSFPSFLVLSTGLAIVYFVVEYDKSKLQLLESVIKALCFFHLMFVEVSYWLLATL